MRKWLVVVAVVLVDLGARAQTPPQSVPADVQAAGQRVYQNVCAACHDHPQERTPSRTALTITQSPDYIVRVLTGGVMREQAASLSADDKKAVAAYLVGRMPGSAADVDITANRCHAAAPTPELGGSAWNGWGGPADGGLRYQRDPGLAAADVPKLKLKWAFAFPGGTSSQATVVGQMVFVPAMGGVVFALDARTGCTYWATDFGSPVRTAISVARLPSGGYAAFAGDGKGVVHALDAASGKELWSTLVESHPLVRLTGSPTVYEGRLYQPVSAFEENVARGNYACCTFRGSLVALDVATGRIVWKTYTIDEQPTARDTGGFGPAGAAIWSAPTVDVRRRVIYVGTGNAYTVPADPASDAIIAFDLATGEKRWVTQIHAGDALLARGPDFDIGSSPVLVTLQSGKDRLFVFSKSGEVIALDPDQKGRELWRTRVGRGGPLGGIEWGGASDGERLFVPVADAGFRGRPAGEPGLSTLSVETGDLLWKVPAPNPVCAWEGACPNAQSSAPAAIPGVVFSGSWDGHERAYDAATGKVVWDFDTGVPQKAVNGGTANGGSMDQGAQTIAGGQLFVSSGARNGHPGNALLVFSVDGK